MPSPCSSDGGRVFLFADLDNCLFQSGWRMTSAVGTSASTNSSGEPQGLMSQGQETLVKWLGQSTHLIPTTGRSPEQLGRVKLTFEEQAICLQGAVILDSQRQVIPEWWERVRTQSQRHRSELLALLEATQAAAQRWGFKASVLSHLGMPIYLHFHRPDRTATNQQQLRDELVQLVPAKWSMRRDTAAVVILPPHLGKEVAVGYLIEHLAGPDDLTVGLGHSEVDAPFQALCQLSMRPEEGLVEGCER